MKFNMKDGGFYTELPYGRLDISGNEENGFRPFQLLVTSVAVCSGGVLRKVLEKQRMEVEDMTITADVKRNEEAANRIEKITIHFKIKGKKLEEKKVAKALELAQKNCSMFQSVIGAIDVTETFELV
ncbi:OsmC family protein [Bacillus chungangensis]|uniref:OsmC-like protein n=1 Tax=Bacillus chungangensis TaxID=587633 RepID=A0ABT9WSG0_9BACI|nr:OsmC family protein [Bacillus chungangensis]MDQ0175665.1 putative OsmC-like protein [Bacillus chungangensis]